MQCVFTLTAHLNSNKPYVTSLLENYFFLLLCLWVFFMIYMSVYCICFWNWSVLLHSSQNWKKIQSEAFYGDLPSPSWDYLSTLGWGSLRTVDRGSCDSPQVARCPQSLGTPRDGSGSRVHTFQAKVRARIVTATLKAACLVTWLQVSPGASPQRFCHLLGAFLGHGYQLPSTFISLGQSSKIHFCQTPNTKAVSSLHHSSHPKTPRRIH